MHSGRSDKEPTTVFTGGGGGGWRYFARPKKATEKVESDCCLHARWLRRKEKVLWTFTGKIHRTQSGETRPTALIANSHVCWGYRSAERKGKQALSWRQSLESIPFSRHQHAFVKWHVRLCPCWFYTSSRWHFKTNKKISQKVFITTIFPLFYGVLCLCLSSVTLSNLIWFFILWLCENLLIITHWSDMTSS